MDLCSHIKTLLFDLDGTLYGIENGYEDHVRQNVFAFMHEKLGVAKEMCESEWRAGFTMHNQTLKGLRSRGHEIDKEEFWDFIRSGREKFLKPAPEVASGLGAMAQEKWVLTNCNEKHAKLALQDMALDAHFKDVLGSDFMEPNAKPQEEAFQAALDRMGADAASTMMFEDSVKNLRTCKKMGMMTVLVAGATAKEEGDQPEQLIKEGIVDFVVADCTESELRRMIPGLFAPSLVDVAA